MIEAGIKKRILIMAILIFTTYSHKKPTLANQIHLFYRPKYGDVRSMVIKLYKARRNGNTGSTQLDTFSNCFRVGREVRSKDN